MQFFCARKVLELKHTLVHTGILFIAMSSFGSAFFRTGKEMAEAWQSGMQNPIIILPNAGSLSDAVS
jgi:hypothetical protein